jgi:hypothetical protein
MSIIGSGDITAQVGKTLKAQEEETHLFLGYRVVGTGLGVSPEENPKIPAIMQERRSMRGREVKGEEGRVLVCRSNWFEEFTETKPFF